MSGLIRHATTRLTLIGAGVFAAGAAAVIVAGPALSAPVSTPTGASQSDGTGTSVTTSPSPAVTSTNVSDPRSGDSTGPSVPPTPVTVGDKICPGYGGQFFDTSAPCPPAPSVRVVGPQAVLRARSQSIVHGAGFVAGEHVKVTIEAPTYNLGDVATDHDGSFDVVFTLSTSVAPGVHTLTAAGQLSGRMASVSVRVVDLPDEHGQVRSATHVVVSATAARGGAPSARVVSSSSARESASQGGIATAASFDGKGESSNASGAAVTAALVGAALVATCLAIVLVVRRRASR